MAKEKKQRRKKLAQPSPESLAARAAGFVINENRRGTLVRLMDTAINDWFFERDPFVIHLMVCASYFVLCDLGFNNGKGPRIARDMGRFNMEAVYDFLRHAEADMLNDSVDLVPTISQWMLFDAIESFERLFGGRTLYMRTFEAYYAVWPTTVHAELPKHAEPFLPEGISVEEAQRLGRLEFFAKITEMFAAQVPSSR